MNPRGLRYPGYAGHDPIKVRGTIAWLRRCRDRRSAIRAAEAAGEVHPGQYAVCYTTDPEWLVDMAINRRAGWPDDPSHTRGSAAPVVRFWPGRMVAPILQYPRSAEGDRFASLARLARAFNSRVIVREREVPARYRARLVHRVHADDDF